MKQMIEPNRWKGYTFEQMQLRHVVVKAQCEIEKYRLQNAAKEIKENSPVLNGSFLSRTMALSSYVDYGIMAFSIGRRLFKAFRRKKSAT